MDDMTVASWLTLKTPQSRCPPHGPYLCLSEFKRDDFAKVEVAVSIQETAEVASYLTELHAPTPRSEREGAPQRYVQHSEDLSHTPSPP